MKKVEITLSERRNKEDQGIEMERIRSGPEANRDEKSEKLIKINLIRVNKRKRRQFKKKGLDIILYVLRFIHENHSEYNSC